MKAEILIWNTKSLGSIKICKNLKNNLNRLPFGKIVESNIVNNSQHLLIVIQRRTIFQGYFYNNYLLFEISSGVKVFDHSNEDPYRDPSKAQS